MTKTESKTASAAVKDILLSNPDGLHEVIRAVMQEVLEAEMDEALDASKGERTPERLGYRSGYYGRTLVTRVGKLELRVPQSICITSGSTICDTTWPSQASVSFEFGNLCWQISCLRQKPMVPLAGLEPATPRSTIWCSNQLSYNGTSA